MTLTPAEVLTALDIARLLVQYQRRDGFIVETSTLALMERLSEHVRSNAT